MIQKSKKNARLGRSSAVGLKDGPGRGRLVMVWGGYKKTGTAPDTYGRYDYLSGTYMPVPCTRDVYDYTLFAVGIEVSAKAMGTAEFALQLAPDGSLHVVLVKEATYFTSEAEAADAADKWLAAGGVGVTLEDVDEMKRREQARRSRVTYPKVLRLLKNLSDEDIAQLAKAGAALVEKRKSSTR